ncbi:uncharacterized protein ACNLHF_025653 [Anomaloglossus baeobatrachus]
MPHPTGQIRLRRAQRSRLLIILLLLLRRRRRQAMTKKMWVHPLVMAREEKGHFASLYTDLRRYPDKFMSFCRLPINSFDHLLAIVKTDLTYKDTVMRRSISAEERLLITLRAALVPPTGPDGSRTPNGLSAIFSVPTVSDSWICVVTDLPVPLVPDPA